MPAVVDGANGITITGTANAIVNSSVINLVSGANTIVVNTTAISVGNSTVNTGISLDYITFSDGTYRSSFASVIGYPGLSVTNTQTFLSSGTWVKPGSGKFALVRAWGGGGSGTIRYYCCGYIGGSGGGGGAFNEQLFNLADLTANVTVTIGAGGNSTTSASTSNPGGNTSFGSYITAGGGGGVSIYGNAAGGVNVNTAADSMVMVTIAGANGASNSATLQSNVAFAYTISNPRGTFSNTNVYTGGNGSYSGIQNSTFGGGGGGGWQGGVLKSPGISIYGGNGGYANSGNSTLSKGCDGKVPGGGGGAFSKYSSTDLSGAGGNGQVIVYVYN